MRNQQPDHEVQPEQIEQANEEAVSRVKDLIEDLKEVERYERNLIDDPPPDGNR